MKKQTASVIIILFFLLTTNLLYSQNGWQVLNSEPNYNIKTISVLDSSNVYVLGQEHLERQKILKTSNGGLNWMQVNLEPYFYSDSNFSILDMSFLNKDTGVILAKISNNIYPVIRTTNGGINWTGVISFQNIYSAYNIQFRGKDTIYLTMDAITVVPPIQLRNTQLLKTTNFGLSWTIIASEHFSNIGFYFANSLKGVTLLNRGFFYTSNGGANWNQYTSTLSGSFNCYGFNPEINYAYVFVSQQLFKTTNWGFLGILLTQILLAMLVFLQATTLVIAISQVEFIKRQMEHLTGLRIFL